MSETGTTKKTGSCPLCLSMNDRWMVQCNHESCLKRYHLRCVGLSVKESQKNVWVCAECNVRDKYDTPRSTIAFERQLSSTKISETENTVIQKKNHSNPFLSMSKISDVIETEATHTLVPRGSNSNKGSSSSSSKHSKSKMELLKRKEELLKKEQEIVEQQLRLLDEMSNSDSDQSNESAYRSCFPNDKKLNESHTHNVEEQQKSVHFDLTPRQSTRNTSNNPFFMENQTSNELNARNWAAGHALPKNHPTFSGKSEENQSSNELNVRHWTARHALPKNLPNFSGKPEEWVTFISAYDHANKAGGFSNVENLPRLEASIKGAAREFVKSLFSSPDNVPLIINTLRRMFGRPEQLMKTQMDEIRKMRRPDPNKPETVLFFAASVQNLWASMKASNLSSYLNNPNMMQELVDMLPENMKWEWGDKLRRSSNDIESFTTWLDDVSERICTVNPLIDLTKGFDQKNTFKRKENINLNIVTDNNDCLTCDGNCPSVDTCSMFLQQNVDERWRTIRAKGLCRKCLRKHVIKPPYRCSAERKCDVTNCPGGHHPLVHREFTVESNHHACVNSENVRFRYVPVKLIHGDKESFEWAFMDSGSSGTFMERELAVELGLTGPISSLCIKHTSDKSYVEQQSMRVNASITGTFVNARRYTLSGIQTMEKLSLEQQTLDYDTIASRYSHIRNLPVDSYANVKPRILIGLNNWSLGVPTKVKMRNADEPIAARCKLGWTIYAATTNGMEYSLNYCNLDVSVDIEDSQNDIDLHQAMRDFFSLESLGVRPPVDDITSVQLRRAYDIMRKTTAMHDGRMTTGLLWKSEDVQLPDSFPTALRRLKCLEFRMKRDPKLAEAAREQIDRYLANGYLRKLSEEELNNSNVKKWYLPMFPVTNPNKPGRYRMVFDAAQEVDGISLNSLLLQGPDLGSSLIAVLIKFMQEKIAIAADIKDMFLRVKMIDDDQHCQRVLWRNDPSEPPSTYVLQTLTFGAKCSPTSAIYAKNINAENFRAEYPRAVEAICENHYVDDFMDSVATVEEAIELANQVKLIHQNAGFVMHQWKSNSAAFMSQMHEETVDAVNLGLDQEQVEKVLGMWWFPWSDFITFSLKFNKGPESVLRGERKPTKREILRVLMSLYDPLGLLTHFTTYLKVLLQQIWRSKITWDETIEDRHVDQWNLWLQVLSQVESLRIPRCYLKDFESYDGLDAQLHIFVDASRTCSAAVAYLRIQNGPKVVCSIIMAKSRVAPMRLLSVPKLELVAAVLGARLSVTIKKALKVKLSKTVFWSDSRSTLLWLRSDTMDLKGQFEQFKVAEIQDITEISNWRYVLSRLNVADDATKWEKSFNLDDTSRWFIGPSFLYENESNWPEDVTLVTKKQEIHHIVVKEVATPICLNYKAFSSWKQMYRALAYGLRALKVWKKKVTLNPFVTMDKTILTSDELQMAEINLIKIVQTDRYDKEIGLIKAGKDIPKNSKIYALSPIIIDDVLRIQGRTSAVCLPSPYETPDQHVEILQDVTQPIILPGDHLATQMLVQMYHEKFRHVQHETVVNEIRQRFHISNVRQVLKRVIRNCSRCKILNATPSPPQMAALPKARLSPFVPPFTYTGIDCFGPIEVVVGRRHEKRWVVLFTCLTIRAVHLEIVHGMDHDSFIMALRNFMQRRGEPREVFSDNGTNFVKGERILREEYDKINMNDVAKQFVSPKLKWNFNPPESQHMGGAWERLVRSIKLAFYSIQPTRTMNDQLLRSYLMEAENIVNSRPLTYVPLGSENEEALTPNHFLRGSSNGGKPIGTFDDDAKFLRSNWLNSQLYSRHFWKRWIMEYLPDLTRRSKWYTRVDPLKEGDVVLIVDPDLHRNCWPKGRITMVNVSKDGQVRSAVVQTATGYLTRPAVKLAKLDILECKASCSSIEEEVLDGAVIAERH